MIEEKQLITFGVCMTRDLATRARVAAARQNQSRSAFIAELVAAATAREQPAESDGPEGEDGHD
jgi:hypothetical protein